MARRLSQRCSRQLADAHLQLETGMRRRPDPSERRRFISRMNAHRLLILTGASGAGKTTIATALAARRLEGVGVYAFDSVGVPELDEMIACHGSPGAWQRDTLNAWVRQLAANPDGHRVSVLDGQVRPSDARRALAAHGVGGRIVLVDCEVPERTERLVGRGQPELATPEMNRWAAYLRGQADALELAIIDTTGRTIVEATNDLHLRVRAMLSETSESHRRGSEGTSGRGRGW